MPVLFLCLACGLSRPGPQEAERGETTAAKEPSFVGRENCTGCHGEQNRKWQGSHHDLAMDVAKDGTVLGDFDGATFTYAGVTSTFFRQDGSYWVRTDGPDGELADYRVEYVFGVEPLQQYLIAFPGGRYQVLGICWDSRPAAEDGQRWFHLYPEENVTHDDPLHWTSLLQTWNHMCAECHSTNLEKGYRLAEDRYQTTWSEIDVACEACHGPGSEHLAWAEAVEAGSATGGNSDKGLALRLADDDGGAWIFDLDTGIAQRNPPRSSHLEIEACGRCHARRSVNSEYYVYGRPLMDSHRPALLTTELYYADGQILDEVYVYGSFLQSKMYRAGVTCRDCHDPHSLELRGDLDGVCARCHLPRKFAVPAHHFHPADSAGTSCVGCHMPARDYMVVDPRRDHSFRVPRPDLTVELGTPNACVTCHADRSPRWAADAVAEHYPGRAGEPHYGEVLHAGRQGLAGAEVELARLVEDPERPGIVRATALSLLRRFIEPGRDRPARDRPASLATVEQALGDGDPLVRFAALQVTEGIEPRYRLELAAPSLGDPVRTVRLEAARVLAPVPAELLSAEQAAHLEAVLAEYEDAQLANADRPEAHLNLGVLYAQTGELERAESAYLRALELAPWPAPAYVNLADLYRQQGREADGERTLRQGLAVAPGDGDLHHALGLLLVRTGHLAAALASLEKAAELRPEEPSYDYVFGVALQSSGDPDRALEVLRRAHERHPGDRQLLYALATISRDRGAFADAVGYARKIVELSPGDPDVRAFLAGLRLLQSEGRPG
ncbi:MAG: tetratricopeptide repeat protein [Thermoanaerobaculia bacterium]